MPQKHCDGSFYYAQISLSFLHFAVHCFDVALSSYLTGNSSVLSEGSLCLSIWDHPREKVNVCLKLPEVPNDVFPASQYLTRSLEATVSLVKARRTPLT